MGGVIDTIGNGVKAITGGGVQKRPGSTVTQQPGAPPTSGTAAPFSPASTPYTTGPGVTSGVSQGQFEGLDFTKHGPAESYYQNNSSVYQQPSFGEVNNQGLVGQYSDPNSRPAVTNNSQTWFDQYSGSMPNLSANPGLAPYFENAKARAQESINQATAARGSYGSSSANDQIARAFTDLEGQRALKEADYALQRAGEDRAWQSLGGQLAGSADAGSRAISQDEQNWVGLLSNLGMDASKMGLDRTNAGMDAALGAQGAERSRGQDYFNNTTAAGDRFSDQMLRIMLQALGIDADLFGAGNSGSVAEGNAALANEQANAATTADALKTGYTIYSGSQ
jgi:hypothetical protein